MNYKFHFSFSILILNYYFQFSFKKIAHLLKKVLYTR
nr:MAG TPA: hypothetical protein [Caudoviricetes sp.]